jgi:methionine sulfoxide reductase heme-binding subunit
VSSELLWYTTRATGLTAFVLLTATVVLGLLARRRVSSPRWTKFMQREVHRQISMVAVCFLAIHILSSVLDTYVNIGWLAIVVPFTSPYERFFVGLGAIALDLALAVFVSSLVKDRISTRVWRAIHWLAYGSWPVAVAHGIGSGTDLRLDWVDAIVGACCGSVVLAVALRFATSPKDAQRPASGRLGRALEDVRPKRGSDGLRFGEPRQAEHLLDAAEQREVVVVHVAHGPGLHER